MFSKQFCVRSLSLSLPFSHQDDPTRHSLIVSVQTLNMFSFSFEINLDSSRLLQGQRHIHCHSFKTFSNSKNYRYSVIVHSSSFVMATASSSRQDAAVQSTNDDAATCKCSAVRLGYWKDPYVQFFAKPCDRKPPEINRGYYARVKGIDSLLKQFLQVVWHFWSYD